MTQEAMKLALEALYPIAHNTTDDPRGQAYKAITAIKEALAQTQEPDDIASILACRDMLDAQPVPPRTEQEPWCMKMNDCKTKCKDCPDEPPQRTWVGLTAGEILDTLISVDEKTVRLPSMLGQFACAIEAKLKEKNT